MSSLGYQKYLQLMQLADTALPIGATAHSFGLETLVAEGYLTGADLEAFFRAYIQETGAVEGYFCWQAYQLLDGENFAADWLELNQQLSALKLARESRAASATLGKRFLQLVAALELPASAQTYLNQAINAARQTEVDVHHAPAFGLVGRLLDVEKMLVVMAYLQQSVAGLVSACQRLMPVGQKQASQLMWHLKPTIGATAEKIITEPATVGYAMTTLLDLASMRHPHLPTRLFIS